MFDDASGIEPASSTARLSRSQLEMLRSDFIADPESTDLARLRPVIARSWRRSLACNIDPDMGVVSKIVEPRLDEQFLRCAEPALADLERLCLDTNGCVGLSDSMGTMALLRGEPSVVRFADRLFPTRGGQFSEDVSGTNSDGTALEERAAVQVWAGEHYTEALQNFSCTSVPIWDPLRRSVRGVLSLTLPEKLAREADPRSIMLIVQGAAARVTLGLASQMAAREQGLLSAYLREVRKRGTEAVVALDDRTTIASRTAMQKLKQSDYALLAAYAREARESGRSTEHTVVLEPGRSLRLTAQPVTTGGDNTGAVVRVREVEPQTRRVSSLPPSRSDTFDKVVGASVALRRALAVVSTSAARRLCIYLVGEPGTGKTLLAQQFAVALGADLVSIDCSIAEDVERTSSLVQDISAGSLLLLQHLDRLPSASLSSLTRQLESARPEMVLATLEKVSSEVLPLLSAIEAVEVAVPPLRARREDIPLLVQKLGQGLPGGPYTATPRLLEVLTSADWPGNVEQLRKVVESTAARSIGGELSLDSLSEVHRRELSRSKLSRLEEGELQHIRAALVETNGNRVRAAALLQIGRSTLYRKIENFQRRGFELLTEG